MDCPSDETLRSLLGDAAQDTSSSEVISHLARCDACQHRIGSWDQTERMEEILRAAGNSGIVYEGPTDHESDVTNVYGQTPIRQIGQYQLLRSIGHGGGGEVFEARHTLLNRRVAIKLLSNRHCQTPAVRLRFVREMESIGQLDHPNIVHAYDAGEVDGTLYLAMELVEGLNLESLAQRFGPMEISVACEVIRQAALGLQHVHESGLVHRDLKPSNLLVCKSGVKIADLGLAMFNGGEVSDDRNGDERLTGEHTVLGTVDYMAPEQAEGSRDVDIRADLYSLGCTLFRLLVGRPPYALPENSTPMKKMWAHASARTPDVCRFRPETPSALAAIVKRLMSKSREDRFAEPRELVEAITPFCVTIEFSSLILSGGAITGKPTAGTRSSTLRDSGIPASEAPTPSASGVRISPPVPAGSRPGFATLAAIACLVAAVAWLGIQVLNEKRPGEVNQALTADASTTVPQPVATPVAVGGNHDLANAAQPVRRTALEEIWFQEFACLPRDHAWKGQSGIGKVALDESLQALDIRANKTLRLAKLGELDAADVDVELAMDFTPQSGKGAFGFYFGFHEPNAATDRQAQFQAIQVLWLGEGERNRSVLVMRCLKVIDAKTGQANGERSQSHRIPVPGNLRTVRLKVRLKGDLLVGATLNGSNCDNLTADAANIQFSPDDYRGPFGICVEEGAVEIHAPEFSRNK